MAIGFVVRSVRGCPIMSRMGGDGVISFAKWIRVLVWVGATACVAAVAVGRMSSPELSLRSMQPIRYAGLSALISSTHDGRLSFVDLETGKGQVMDVADGDQFSQMAWSPWVDESGEGQVAGFWRSYSGRNEQGMASEIGLARYRFPGGEPLDRVATDITPVSPPCWYPGTRAQILFADGGGTLHRFAFEGTHRSGTTLDGCDLAPSPIVWKIAPPGVDERSVRMMDPVWPEGRAMEGRLIVSLSMHRVEGDRHFTPPRLWWLKLDEAGEAIEAAGPLVRRDDSLDVRERCARVTRTPSGEYRIAYLVRDAASTDWKMTVAPLEFDDQGLPFVRPELASSDARVQAPIAPAFSSDGRWLYYLSDPHRPQSMKRVAVPRVFTPGEVRS